VALGEEKETAVPAWESVIIRERDGKKSQDQPDSGTWKKREGDEKPGKKRTGGITDPERKKVRPAGRPAIEQL